MFHIEITQIFKIIATLGLALSHWNKTTAINKDELQKGKTPNEEEVEQIT